ncbi:MAG: hypothetical protein ACOC7W_02130 [Desulfosalsimonas sp.]
MKISRDSLSRRKEHTGYRVIPVHSLLLLVMALLIALGLIGLDVAAGEEKYREYIWVPILLVSFSSVLFILAAARIVRHRRTDSSR